MDITHFECNSGEILFDTNLIDQELREFYISKFADQGIKQRYINKNKVQKALNLITSEEFHYAL